MLLAAAVLALAERRGRPALLWGGLALLVPAALMELALLLPANPLWVLQAVGPWPLINQLGLAYGVPAAVLALIFRLRPWPRPAARAFGAAALGLALVWLSLEVRRAFHGQILSLGETGDAEWYAYSALWLAFAAAMLVAGLLRNRLVLRRAGLVLVALVLAKVVLFDMSALAGLWRALSFLALGGVMVGIGWAYRKLAPS